MRQNLNWMSRLGTLKWSLLIALGIAVLFLLGVFEPLELLTLDSRFHLQPPRSFSPEIAIIGITPQCVERMGKFPWPRSVYAGVIDYLAEANAKVIPFDIFFPVAGEEGEDLELAEATQRAGNVVYPVFSPVTLDHRQKGPVHRVSSLRQNLPSLSEAAAGVGHINVPSDRDGKVRRTPVALEYDGKLVYQLGLEAVIHYWGIDKKSITLEKGGLQIGQRKFPVSRKGYLLINYHDQEEELDFYPFHEVAERRSPAENFEKKIVLIGQTSHGLPNADLVSTPHGRGYGTILQATIIDNFLNDDFLSRQGLISSLVTILFLSFLSGMLFAKSSLPGSIIFYLFLSAVVYAGGIYLFNERRVVVEVVPCLAALGGNFGFSLVLGLRASRREAGRKDLQLATVLKTSGISAEDLDVEKIPQVIASSVGEAVGVEALSLYLSDGSANSLSLEGEYHLNGQLSREEMSEIAAIANRLVQSRGEPFLTRRLNREPEFEGVGSQVSSFLSSPLVVKEQVKGVLNFYNKRPSGVSPADHFTEEDLRLISVLSRQAAVILENRHLLKDLMVKNEKLTQTMRELKSAEEQLIRSEKLSAVGRTASMIIHDIKNPLGVARAYAELLGEIQDEAERRKYTQIILGEMDRVTEMAQDILDYTKGKSVLNPQTVRVGSLVEEVIFLLEKDFENREVRIVRELFFEGPMNIDEEKMMRVFLNLARNAAEAMKEGGKVSIFSEKKPPWVEFRVCDDGPGIPERIKDDLFEPFVTEGKQQGTGLGLAIVKKIVEDHGGTIRVETAIGVGTTFVFQLPLGAGKNGRGDTEWQQDQMEMLPRASC